MQRRSVLKYSDQVLVAEWLPRALANLRLRWRKVPFPRVWVSGILSLLTTREPLRSIADRLSPHLHRFSMGLQARSSRLLLA